MTSSPVLTVNPKLFVSEGIQDELEVSVIKTAKFLYLSDVQKRL